MTTASCKIRLNGDEVLQIVEEHVARLLEERGGGVVSATPVFQYTLHDVGVGGHDGGSAVSRWWVLVDAQPRVGARSPGNEAGGRALTDREKKLVQAAVVHALRYSALLVDDEIGGGARLLRETADAVDGVKDWTDCWCCPLCEEITCDQSCALHGLRESNHD